MVNELACLDRAGWCHLSHGNTFLGSLCLWRGLETVDCLVVDLLGRQMHLGILGLVLVALLGRQMHLDIFGLALVALLGRQMHLGIFRLVLRALLGWQTHE